MGMGFNSVTLLGNLVRDPEIRYINSGKAVCKFTLAVGRTKDETDFIDCVAWEKTAETVNEYLKKGSQALIQGRLSIRPYETKEGEKRKAVEVVVGMVRFIGGRRDGNGEYDGSAREFSPRGAGRASDDEMEDEIPF